MADTRITARININNQEINAGTSTSGLSYTQTTNRYFYNRQTLGTSWEAVNFNDLTNCKMIYIENTSTSSVQLSQDNTDSKLFSTIGPNGSGSNFALLPTSASSTTLYAKAGAASVDIIVVGYQV